MLRRVPPLYWLVSLLAELQVPLHPPLRALFLLFGPTNALLFGPTNAHEVQRRSIGFRLLI